MGLTNDSIKHSTAKSFEKYEDHEQQEQPTLEVEDIVDSTGKLINQHMTKLSMLKFNYNLVKKWSLAR